MEKTLLIIAEYGIHARPATRLVNVAMRYESQIFMESLGKRVNLKSILGVMSLGVYRGEQIKIIINGKDQEKAMQGLGEFLIAEGLGREV